MMAPGTQASFALRDRMKFVEITGATLLKLTDSNEVPQLRAAGVTDESKIRINPQGDIELQKRGSWIVIGGLLGDYASRIRKLTGQDWN
jgi:ribosome biogenesis SPOUT family RNA methylase Rps3